MDGVLSIILLFITVFYCLVENNVKVVKKPVKSMKIGVFTCLDSFLVKNIDVLNL